MSTAIKYNNETEWHAIRSRGIGGSDVGAILGLSPWKTPVQVWLEKTGQSEPVKPSMAMQAGTYLEEMVAWMYSNETGNRVQRYNFTLQDEIFIANVDRLVVMPGNKKASARSRITTPVILECKTSSDYSWDEVPLYYQAQVQHYMGIIDGVERTDVAVFFKPSNDFHVFRVYRNQQTIDDLRLYLKYWWAEHVVGNVAPEPANENDCLRLWRLSREERIAATDEIMETVENLRRLRDERRVLDETEERLRTVLASYMCDKDTLVHPETGARLLTYKTSKDRERVDYNGLIQALGVRSGLNDEEINTLRGKFTTRTPGNRVMLLKAGKEQNHVK